MRNLSITLEKCTHVKLMLIHEEMIDSIDNNEFINIIDSNSTIINNYQNIDEDVNELNRNYVTFNIEDLTRSAINIDMK